MKKQHISSKKLRNKIEEMHLRDIEDSFIQFNKTYYRAMNIMLSFVKNRPIHTVERNLLDDSSEFMRAVVFSLSVIRQFGLSFDVRNFITYVNKFLEDNELLEKYGINSTTVTAIDTAIPYTLMVK